MTDLYKNYITVRSRCAQKASGIKRNWAGSRKCRTLIVTDDKRIQKSQIFPFFFYAREIKEKWDVDFRVEMLSRVMENPSSSVKDASLILYQPWFSLGQENIVKVLQALIDRNPLAKIVYIDSGAPTDLRYANALNEYIDLCVKKHVFRDREQYGKATNGDTTLVEYYEDFFALPRSAEVKFPVPQDFLEKLQIGPSFFTDSAMLPFLSCYERPESSRKIYIVHARLGATGSPWYNAMRTSALEKCRIFCDANSVISDKLISYRAYMEELRQSKICFSPFGYGEVCWRDYEAILCGALLVKPDMSHVETLPDIFIPYETYVPVQWDFSDLESQIEYYLSNQNEMSDIISNAYNVLRKYCLNAGFVDQMSPLFEMARNAVDPSISS